MSHKGDFNPSAVVNGRVTTLANGNSVATTIANANVIVFKDGSNANSVEGVTLSVDWGKTGRHLVSVNTAANGTYYAAGSMFNVEFANGNCNGTSLAGYGIYSFTIRVATANTVNTAAGLTFEHTGNQTGSVNAVNQTVNANVTHWNSVVVASLGAANGPIINGVNGGNIAVGHISVVASALNANGITVVANGTGHGVGVLSGCGATGDAVRLVSNATTGNAVAVFGNGGANAVSIVSSTSGNGLVIIGRGGPTSQAVRVTSVGGTAASAFKIDNQDGGLGFVADRFDVTGVGSFSGGLLANITGNMTGSVNSVNQGVNANIATWLGVTPEPLVSNRVVVLVGAMNTGVIVAGTIASGELTNIELAVWDKANGLETGATMRQGVRYTAAASAGNLTGGNTNQVVITGMGVVTTRITAAVEANGNTRTVVLS